MSIPNTAKHDIMESVLLKGDLAKLTPDERVRYYGEVCRSLGLNPLTKPFEYINLNGKLTLYALRTCADQLRKINGVSLEIVSREVKNDILTVHVRAKLPDGRADEDVGTVAFPDTLKGDARANAELKAVTKAKRRATLSICGLGWLDETEIPLPPSSITNSAADGNETDNSAGRITPEQAKTLSTLILGSGFNIARFCAYAKIATLEELPAWRYEAAVAAINRAGDARKKAGGT